MSLWANIKQRRITQILISYLVGGWIAVSVIDQVVDREVLPRYVYLVAFTLFLFGIPAALVIGWYHGEKGTQKTPPLEIALLALLTLGAGATSWLTVKQELVVLAAEEGGLDLRSIAVLYFTGQDEETALVGEGITEDLIARLGRSDGLAVVSRNGSRQVRDAGMTIDEAGEFLDVGTLLEGEVRRAGEDIVVSVQIMTRDYGRLGNVSVWGAADDLQTLRDDVANEIEEEFRTALGTELRFRENQSAAPNNGSFLAVTRGERALERAINANVQGDEVEAAARFQEAERSFMEAVELADEWPHPWVLLSQVSYRKARALASSRDEMADFFDEAVAHADAALALDPRNAAALNWRGTATYAKYIFGLAENEEARSELLRLAQSDLERARDWDPDLAEASATLSHLYYYTEDMASAALAAQRAYESDAFLSLADQILGRVFITNYDLERVDQAERWCDEGRRRFPENYLFYQCRLYLMTMQGIEPDIDRAWALVDSIEAVSGSVWDRLEPTATILVGGAIARAGLADSASAVLERGRRPTEADPLGQLLYLEAAMRILNGEEDEAVRLLQRYTALTPGHFAQDQVLHWWWSSLRGNPDFERMRRLN